MLVARKPFFDGYRSAFGPLTGPQVTGLETLLSFIETDPALTDPRWAAYMLATVKHECADTYHPITERGKRAYFDKYEPNTPIGKVLGNMRLGDGYLYRGRGYVQITGRANYKRMTETLGLEPLESLTESPDLALRPDISYRIMSVGMRLGMFTGKRLAQYISSERCEYTQARRVINRLDRAELIADYARVFESVISSGLTHTTTTVSPD